MTQQREMTLPAIRERFENGSWDSADLQWLYAPAALVEPSVAKTASVSGEFASLDSSAPVKRG